MLFFQNLKSCAYCLFGIIAIISNNISTEARG